MSNITLEIEEQPNNETCCIILDYYCFDVFLENNNYRFRASVCVLLFFIVSYMYVFIVANPTLLNME
jgi:hypothetical protein